MQAITLTIKSSLPATLGCNLAEVVNGSVVARMAVYGVAAAGGRQRDRSANQVRGASHIYAIEIPARASFPNPLCKYRIFIIDLCMRSYFFGHASS
jgi:hypothetical protein